jgi:hypothetical protein
MGCEVLPIGPLEPPWLWRDVAVPQSRCDAPRAPCAPRAIRRYAPPTLSRIRVWLLQAPANFFLLGGGFNPVFSAQIFFRDAPMRAFLLLRLREHDAGRHGRKKGFRRDGDQ